MFEILLLLCLWALIGFIISYERLCSKDLFFSQEPTGKAVITLVTACILYEPFIRSQFFNKLK